MTVLHTSGSEPRRCGAAWNFLLRLQAALLLAATPPAFLSAAEPASSPHASTSTGPAAAVQTGPAPLSAAPQPGRKSRNIIFIAVDDLNDWVGCLGGHPQAKTPCIDRLAARGVVFTNAHCQAPLCNPSRTSVLTGLRPSTTGIHGLAPGFRSVAALKEHVTLPQTFTAAGWNTFTCGKIYHDGSLPAGERAREFATWGPSPGMGKPAKRFVALPDPHPAMDWGPFPEKDADQADWKIADAAIEAIRGFAAAKKKEADAADSTKEKPFFVACGFRLPHVPCFASRKWFDLHPAAKLVLPPVKEDDRNDVPRFAWNLHWKLPEPRLATLRRIGEWDSLVQSYLASTSFVDSQIGRVLDALEASGEAENTLVVLWSDHGYHLGEKAITGKNTLWERSTRVPLVVCGPGAVKGGKCARPVELLDLFPTLLDLCGLPPRNDLEGISLRPWLEDPSAPRSRPAITTHNQGCHAVRSETHRYIRYRDGSEELYDLAADPHEWTNLAASPAHAEVKAALARSLPKVDAPAVPGSKHRVLTTDPASGLPVWEGIPIRPEDPIPE